MTSGDLPITPPRRLRSFLSHIFPVNGEEIPALVAAFLSMFCLLTAYMVLRPVRESMGITSGVAKLPLLQWGTFAGVLLAQPVFGWLAARLPRTRLVPWVYLFFMLDLAAFYGWFQSSTDATWIARVFFIWMSVTNLIAVSLFWSLMADVFQPAQGARLFGIVSSGASLGGILGPLITRTFVAELGRPAMMLIAAAFLGFAVVCMRYLAGWHARHVTGTRTVEANEPLGGSAWAGLRLLLERPALMAIGVFTILLSWSGALLYLQQMNLVAAAYQDPSLQTQLFAELDLKVQVISLVVQLFVFNRLLRWWGFTALVLLVPVLLTCGFLGIATLPTLSLVLGIMVMRRVGEYSITRPSRELLFTTFDREAKYKAKNVLDSFVFRIGDATGGSIYAGLAAIPLGTTGIAIVGALLSVVWGASGVALGRAFKRATRAPVP